MTETKPEKKQLSEEEKEKQIVDTTLLEFNKNIKRLMGYSKGMSKKAFGRAVVTAIYAGILQKPVNLKDQHEIRLAELFETTMHYRNILLAEIIKQTQKQGEKNERTKKEEPTTTKS